MYAAVDYRRHHHHHHYVDIGNDYDNDYEWFRRSYQMVRREMLSFPFSPYSLAVRFQKQCPLIRMHKHKRVDANSNSSLIELKS